MSDYLHTIVLLIKTSKIINILSRESRDHELAQ